MTIKQSLTELLDGVRKAYQEDLKRFKASGKTSKSLRTDIKINGDYQGKLYATGSILTLFNGRKPGKFPPIEAILNWIRDKKIRPRDPKTSERSLAFVFARAIAKKGTHIYQGRVDPLNADEQIEKLQDEFLKNLNDTNKKLISESIKSI